MSLLDLVNNQDSFQYYYGGIGNFTQKSLGFGEQGGPTSFLSQPYVQVPPGSSLNIIDDITGIPTPQGEIGDIFQEKTRDSLRMRRFFQDIKYSHFFIDKQIGLQLMNPKMQVGKILGLEYTRLYNGGINTLAQIDYNGTGINIPRHGLLPLPDDGLLSYEKTVGSQNLNNDNSDNRLLKLLKESKGDEQGNVETEAGQSFNELSGWGGPNSFFGLGETNIKRYDDTSNNIDRQIVENILDGGDVALKNNFTTFTSGMYKKRSDANYTDFESERTDFRELINTYSSKKILPSYSPNDNITVRLNYSNPGSWFDRREITNVNPNFIDAISTDDSIKTNENFNDESLKDLIKFRFESINTDKPTTTSLLVFRAYLNGGINDVYSPTWEPYQYVGRAEDFFVYSHFKRDIKFGFKIAAQSRNELMPLYNKLNKLVSNTAPDLIRIGSVMRGPMMRLTIGDYIFREYGFINSLDINIDENTTWEINLENDKSIGELPHILNVNVGYTLIHKFIPSKGRRFINNTNNGVGGSE